MRYISIKNKENLHEYIFLFFPYVSKSRGSSFCLHKDNERSRLLNSELAESYLHDGVQVLSGRGHGAGVHRRALGHYGDVMVGVLGECRRRDDDRGVVGGRRGRQHLEGGKKKSARKQMR